MTALGNPTRKTVETVTIPIEDGPILSPFRWDTNPNVRRQIVKAVASRQSDDSVLRKWYVRFQYRKLKKDGSFSVIGDGWLSSWDREELVRPEISDCLRLVCDRVGIASHELHNYEDIVEQVRAEIQREGHDDA